MTDSSLGNGPELLVELTADIVAAYVSNHVVPVGELSNLISDVHSALSNTSAPSAPVAVVEKQKPAVSVRKSVQDDQITCLECGGSFKSLKRHRKSIAKNGNCRPIIRWSPRLMRRHVRALPRKWASVSAASAANKPRCDRRTVGSRSGRVSGRGFLQSRKAGRDARFFVDCD